MAELIILILGISLSFLLNEWRVNSAEKKMEKELLTQFRDNLILDSLSLSVQVESLEARTKAARHLLAIEENTAYNDTTARNLILMLNFGGFYPTDITYQEMRSLGNSRLIKDKELLQEMIQLYESDYDLVAEWANTDRAFLLNDLMPYVNRTLPFARQFRYNTMSAAKKRQLMKLLMADETRYLLQYGEILKMGNKQVYAKALQEVRRIIEMLNEELPEESVLAGMMDQPQSE
jgi:hypothetical protein